MQRTDVSLMKYWEMAKRNYNINGEPYGGNPLFVIKVNMC